MDKILGVRMGMLRLIHDSVKSALCATLSRRPCSFIVSMILPPSHQTASREGVHIPSSPVGRYVFKSVFQRKVCWAVRWEIVPFCI